VTFPHSPTPGPRPGPPPGGFRPGPSPGGSPLAPRPGGFGPAPAQQRPREDAGGYDANDQTSDVYDQTPGEDAGGYGAGDETRGDAGGYGAGDETGRDDTRAAAEGGQSTGHPAVDAVLRSLANAARLAPADQIAEYEAAHQVLQETLSGIDG